MHKIFSVYGVALGLWLVAGSTFSACGSSTSGNSNNTSSTGGGGVNGNNSLAAGNGNNDLQGSVNGYTFTPSVGISYNVSDAQGDNFLDLELWDAATACSDLNNIALPPSSNSLVLSLTTLDDNGNTLPIVPGSWPIYSDPNAAAAGNTNSYGFAQIQSFDGNCMATLPNAALIASGGQVNISSINNNAVVGAFSLIFGSDTITGDFNTTACAGLQVVDNANTTQITCAAQ